MRQRGEKGYASALPVRFWIGVPHQPCHRWTGHRGVTVLGQRGGGVPASLTAFLLAEVFGIAIEPPLYSNCKGDKLRPEQVSATGKGRKGFLQFAKA